MQAATVRRLPLALILNAAALVALLAGYGLAFAQVHAYEVGISRQQFTISGSIPTPVLHLMSTTRRGDAIAVIVHGYSGDKELMIGFGLELAKMGVPSYLLDLPGHGESTVPLATVDQTNHTTPQLETALDEVVQYARAHADVPNPKIILLGHSLGTLVVGEYARDQPTSAIAATILISPILRIMPTADHPANLLYLVGQNDIAGLLALAQQDVAPSCSTPTATMPGICSDQAQGSRRQLTVIPGANHITILTDAAAYAEVTQWVSMTDSIPTVAIQSDARLHWTELALLCAVLAIFPLITLGARLLGLVGVKDAGSTETVAPTDSLPALSFWARLGILAGGVVVTVLVLRGWSAAADALHLAGLRTPLSWMGMALADYAGSFALVLALALLGIYRVLRQPWPWPSLARLGPQLALGGVVALALYLTLGELSAFTWERFLLDGPRLWRFLLLLLVNLPLFAIIEGMFGVPGAAGLWRGVFPRLGALLLICVGYVGAIVLDHSLFFLSLLVPIEALLFIIFTALAYQARRQGSAMALASAIFMALLFAWAVAAVFPIVQ